MILRWLLRLSLASAGLLAGAAGVELTLRACYDDLPSLAALSGTDLRFRPERGVGPCPPTLAPREPAPRLSATGAPEWVTFWFAGDSTTAAVEVPSDRSWAWRVAGELAEGRSRAVTNLAVPGADFCAIASQVVGPGAPDEAPDWIFVGAYADDFVAHQVYSIAAGLVLLPSSAPPWLRPAVSRAYLANWLWFTIEPRQEALRKRRLASGTEELFRETTAAIVARGEALGARVVFVLHPPAALSQCASGSAPTATCRWLQEDLGRMAALLEADGRAVVDLRPLYRSRPMPILPRDLERIAAGQLPMGIHVATEGQATIADEVVRQVRLLPGDKVDRRTAARAPSSPPAPSAQSEASAQPAPILAR